MNIIKPGLKYGWPYCYGYQIRDDTFTEKTDRTDLPMDCGQTESPAVTLPPRSIPLGLAFIPDSWPVPWRGRLLIAYHGLSKGKARTVYKIAWLDIDANGKMRDFGDFMTGFLSGKKIYGQPVDLKFDAQGNLFISDDSAGIIYKISPDS